MNRFTWNLLIAFGWALGTTRITVGNMVLGFLLGALVIILLQPRKTPRGYGRRLLAGLSFALFYLGELLLSNLRVAADVLSSQPGRHPAVVAVHLEEGHTGASITMLGNLITMTPGTMTLDVSADLRWIYIHAMFVEDIERFRAQFKHDFERRVLAVVG